MTPARRKQLTRQWVKNSGITFKHLSKCIQVDPTYLSAMVSNKAKRDIPLKTFAKISHYFKVVH